MREIAPGLFHWAALHDGIHKEVSSYFASESGILIDPLFPADGFDGADALEWLAHHGPPKAILLTNRHHYRHSGWVAEAFEIAVHASERGMQEFSAAQRVQPFQFGDRLPGGVIAHEINAICPDETALEIPSVRAVALADGLVRYSSPDGPLSFVPDGLLGDDPEAVKEELHDSYSRLLALNFDHLLLAHGLPAVGDGKDQLRLFLQS
jgi:hypothetical protein